MGPCVAQGRQLVAMRPALPHAELVALARVIAMHRLEPGVDQLRLHIGRRRDRGEKAILGVTRLILPMPASAVDTEAIMAVAASAIRALFAGMAELPAVRLGRARLRADPGLSRPGGGGFYRGRGFFVVPANARPYAAAGPGEPVFRDISGLVEGRGVLDTRLRGYDSRLGEAARAPTSPSSAASPPLTHPPRCPPPRASS